MDTGFDFYDQLNFGDIRLTSRLKKELISKQAHPGMTIYARLGRNGAKAMYRLMRNERTNKEELIRVAHLEALNCIAESEKKIILVPQGTSIMDYTNLLATKGLGTIGDKKDSRGFQIHTAIAATESGIPLGILSQSYINRSPKEGGKAARRTQTPIAAGKACRCIQAMREASAGRATGCTYIHICDYEGDIFSFFDAVQSAGEQCVVRQCRNRSVKIVEDGVPQGMMIRSVGKKFPTVGTIEIPVQRASHTKAQPVMLNISFGKLTIRKSVSGTEETASGDLDLYVIGAEEAHPQKNRTPVQWTLLTNHPIQNFEDAARAVRWYTRRWIIKDFYSALKDDCKAEALQLDTARKLQFMCALYSINALRILQRQLLSQDAPDLPCTSGAAEGD